MKIKRLYNFKVEDFSVCVCFSFILPVMVINNKGGHSFTTFPAEHSQSSVAQNALTVSQQRHLVCLWATFPNYFDRRPRPHHLCRKIIYLIWTNDREPIYRNITVNIVLFFLAKM